LYRSLTEVPAELHQLVSPNTAYTFLDTLLETSQTVSKSLDEVSLFSDYVFKGWKGIIKSSGIQL
jgi:ubiquinone biosynthesis protein COQ9